MLNLQQTCSFYFHTCYVWLPGDESCISAFYLVHILRMWPFGCHCQPVAAHRDPEKATGSNNQKYVKVTIINNVTAKCEDALFYALLIKRVCDVMKVLCLMSAVVK